MQKSENFPFTWHLVVQSNHGGSSDSHWSGKQFRKKSKSASFYALTFFTSSKMFLGELSAVFVDHCTELSSKVSDFLNTLMSHRRATRIPLLYMFFSCMRLHGYDSGDKKELERLGMKVVSVRLSET